METAARLLTAAQCILDGFITRNCLHVSERQKEMTTDVHLRIITRAQCGTTERAATKRPCNDKMRELDRG
jgi:hypothetical protein